MICIRNKYNIIGKGIILKKIYSLITAEVRIHVCHDIRIIVVNHSVYYLFNKFYPLEIELFLFFLYLYEK